jgi:purine-cytosine permease-like protein
MWHFMGLWTFVAGFSFMVPGFVMHDGGFALAAAAGAGLLGYRIYVAYALVGAYLGAQTGQTLTLLTRAVFGRIGRLRFLWPLPTYLFACLWFVLFTIAGWMVASLVGGGDRFNFTVRFSMFGTFWLAFLIATLSQFAINDGNYYEAVNAAQNLLGGWRRWRRSHTCLLLAGCGALAGWIVNYKIMNAWYAVPVFLAITAPCATVIMAVDRFVLPRWLGASRPVGRVPSWQQAAVANWPAIASLMIASVYGAIASAILPAHLGFSAPRN